MSLPRREAAQRLPRREDVYAFVFVIFSRVLGVTDPFMLGSQTHSARPDKRGSFL